MVVVREIVKFMKYIRYGGKNAAMIKCCCLRTFVVIMVSNAMQHCEHRKSAALNIQHSSKTAGYGICRTVLHKSKMTKFLWLFRSEQCQLDERLSNGCLSCEVAVKHGAAVEPGIVGIDLSIHPFQSKCSELRVQGACSMAWRKVLGVYC